MRNDLRSLTIPVDRKYTYIPGLQHDVLPDDFATRACKKQMRVQCSIHMAVVHTDSNFES